MPNAQSLWKGFFDPSTYYTSPPLTDAMVAAAEAVLGYTFPTSYLDLLRVKNGGVPRLQCHPASDAYPENHVRVNVLFGIGGNWGVDSEESGSRHLIREGGFPEIGVAIGWTPTGGHDAVFLDYRECGPRGEPRITIYDAESDESEVLAATFEAFAQGLADCRPYDEQRERALEEWRRANKR